MPTTPNTDLSQVEPFERIVAALHEAAFDDGAWPRATALVDDACGMGGSQLCVVDVRGGAPEYCFGWFFSNGRPRPALEREYRDHFPQDERIARLLLMPAGTLFAAEDLLNERELAASALHRDVLPRWGVASQLVARLDGGNNRHIFWLPLRTSSQGEWRPTHRRLLRRLLPHLGHAVRCGRALSEASANARALATLLDDAGIGAVLLDRFGSVVDANVQGRRQLDRDLLAALGDVLAVPDGPAVVSAAEARPKVFVRRVGSGAAALLVEAKDSG